MRRARGQGSFVGVDERKYSRDFATLIRYYTHIRKIPTPLPTPNWG